MTIFLTGYMASGKTTLGRAFARASGMQFIDLDFYIEQRFRRSVAGIFAEKGEEEFRRIEADVLREVGEFENVVISCGGGTPCFADNMDFMNSRGITVWLDASVPLLCRRILQGGSKRPITARYTPDELPGFVTAHLESRLPFYRKSQICIDGSRLESKAGIDSTVAMLREQLGM